MTGFVNVYTNENSVEMVECFVGLKKEIAYVTKPLRHPSTSRLQLIECKKDLENLSKINKIEYIYVIPINEEHDYYRNLIGNVK